MNNGPVKQLNNFAKVIKVDDKNNSEPIHEDEKNIKNNSNVIVPNIIVREKNPMITFYILIILILLAILISFVVFYILPRIR